METTSEDAMFDGKFLSNDRRATCRTDRLFYLNPTDVKDRKHGSQLVSLPLGCSPLVLQRQNLTKESTNRYILHPILFRYLRFHFEEIFGASLDCELLVVRKQTYCHVFLV